MFFYVFDLLLFSLDHGMVMREEHQKIEMSSIPNHSQIVKRIHHNEKKREIKYKKTLTRKASQTGRLRTPTHHFPTVNMGESSLWGE